MIDISRREVRLRVRIQSVVDERDMLRDLLDQERKTAARAELQANADLLRRCAELERRLHTLRRTLSVVRRSRDKWRERAGCHTTRSSGSFKSPRKVGRPRKETVA